MNDLNNDWVLYGTIFAVVFSIVALLGFAWKAFRGMEGLEKDETQQ